MRNVDYMAVRKNATHGDMADNHVLGGYFFTGRPVYGLARAAAVLLDVQPRKVGGVGRALRN